MAKTKTRSYSYAVLCAAAGLFADEKYLEDICLLEFEDGIIVQGMALVSTSEGWTLAHETHTLHTTDLEPFIQRVLPRLT